MIENKNTQKKPLFWLVSSLLLVVILFSLGTDVKAQYFGQNKVRYKNLKFKVYETPHFELYYYLKNDSLVKRFAKEAEVWYDLHQQVFRDTFTKKNPFILYSNHPDFQQTTALDGEIGVGTGGVTEGMKNRVIMPISLLNHQTRHVLGHELVHAFQYHTLIEGDSTNLENIGNLPLWMVEGMAEYLSVGKQDAYTAMWMRDAFLNKDIPSLRDLTTTNRYFPYRYGQAFWSYIGSTYGDTVIVPFFKETAKYGYEMAIRRTFGYDERTLSSLWKTSIENAYKPYLKDTSQIPVGKLIINEKNGGESYNVAPAISPDGNYVAFLSEKDLLSIDLFLADARTGKIVRKLTSKAKNSHIDEFNFIESAGAWSPDSRRFAFSAFSGGVTKLIIVDIESGKTISTDAMGAVEEFSNITWSPNGSDVAFSGLKEGQSDLFQFNLNTNVLTQLTNDKYSEYHPSYSKDGKTIVFSTDRNTFDKSSVTVEITMSLAVLNLATKAVTDIPVFDGANNLNPQYSADNKSIYFLSNRDGFRNSTASFRVRALVPTVAIAGDTLLCPGSSVLLRAVVGPGPAAYRWSTGATTPSLAVTQPGVYAVQAVFGPGCSATAQVRVRTVAGLAPFTLGADTTLCEGDALVLRAPSPRAAGDTYRWSDGSTGPLLQVTAAGTYTLRITGCGTQSASRRVAVDACVRIGNVITPNQDGRNDRLEAQNLPPGAWGLTVFNRWGRRVYHTAAYGNGWGDTAAAGLYYYLLQQPRTGKTYKGWVEVIR